MQFGSPSIKGIFVMSHVKALQAAKGPEALAELEKRYGKPVRFRAMEDVSVHEEVTIIEHALDILTDGIVLPDARAYEAGRLHFQNFSGTPLGKLVLPFFRNDFKKLIMNADNIAGHVFRGVHFISEDLSPASVRVTMENNDYAIDHFRGFFQAWMEYSGLRGSVEAKDLGDSRYQYTVTWS